MFINEKTDLVQKINILDKLIEYIDERRAKDSNYFDCKDELEIYNDFSLSNSIDIDIDNISFTLDMIEIGKNFRKGTK
jgi:hypothetical protein